MAGAQGLLTGSVRLATTSQHREARAFSPIFTDRNVRKLAPLRDLVSSRTVAFLASMPMAIVLSPAERSVLVRRRLNNKSSAGVPGRHHVNKRNCACSMPSLDRRLRAVSTGVFRNARAFAGIQLPPAAAAVYVRGIVEACRTSTVVGHAKLHHWGDASSA
eukprot:364493-Chlamydomonas_euryale.AAC.11